MRLPVLIAATGLTLTLAACNTIGSAPATPETASSGSPAPVEDFDWFVYVDGGEATLAYGVDETDNTPIMLDCRQASGRVRLSAAAGADAAHEFHLESGGETERYPAQAEPAEHLDLYDGTFLTAEAKTSEPVFQRFRRVGWLAVWEGGERHAYAPHPGSADRIERFFAFCG